MSIEFNDLQISAIRSAMAMMFDDSNEPVLIVGGPGSGKTTVRRELMRLALNWCAVAAVLPTQEFAAPESGYWSKREGFPFKPFVFSANSSAAIKSTGAAALIFFDDVEKMRPAPEGDPVALAARRTLTYRCGKAILFGDVFAPVSHRALNSRTISLGAEPFWLREKRDAEKWAERDAARAAAKAKAMSQIHVGARS